MKPYIYMGYRVNKLIFGITGTEKPLNLGLANDNYTNLTKNKN
ncbi:MAG: hypothetical protein RLZZ184_436 [Cyanobacteriota bacterium]|jgi:hypothetical protein